MSVQTVTAEELERAAVEGQVRYVPHHKCSICNSEVHYKMFPNGSGLDLYFHSACECAWTPDKHITWRQAADWVNLQADPKIKIATAKLFGLILVEFGT